MILSPSSKKFFQVDFHQSRQGENLQAAFSAKPVPEGLKYVECKHGAGGMDPPMCYIPKDYTLQDALGKKNKDHLLQVNFFQHQKQATGGSMTV